MSNLGIKEVARVNKAKLSEILAKYRDFKEIGPWNWLNLSESENCLFVFSSFSKPQEVGITKRS
jgi:hypothetical protein